METISPLHDIKVLVSSYQPVIVMETVEEGRVVELLEIASRELDLPFFEWSAARGLVRRGRGNAIHRTAEPLGLLAHLRANDLEGIFLLKDFARHLQDAVAVRHLRELAQRFARSRSTLVLSGPSIDLPEELEHKAVHYRLGLPDREEIKKAIAAVFKSVGSRQRVESRLRRAEVDELLRALRGLTLHQVRQVVAQAIVADGCLSAEDIRLVLERKAQMIREGGLLEYYPAENNRFELGGFGNLKGWLERARTGFSREARELGLAAPRGILLVGIQGCGKSLAAKVIAREWRQPLLKLDAGRLFDKYIGQSEKNLRRAIELAESMAPVVLWIDEIEKGLAGTRSGDADGGVSLRLLATFLTWLQEKRAEVFVVATANDLSLLPPELLRKGRFDEIFFVDLPDVSERREIFKIHLEVRRQDPLELELDVLVEATEGFSGAEIEQVVTLALYRTLHEKRSLDTELLLEEIRSTVPLSVSRREDIERLRALARQRFVSVR